MQSAKRDSESENSSSDGAADGDDGDWEELQDNEMEEATSCLFTSRTHPSPAAALAHAKDLGFDFAALKQELGLDFYGCIKAINFVRRKVKEAGSAPAGDGAGSEKVKQLVAAAVDGLKRNEFVDEGFLAPVVEGDPLLFSMDFPDDGQEAEEQPTAPHGTTVEELARENEQLRFQLLELTIELEEKEAALGAGTSGSSSAAPLADGGAPQRSAGGPSGLQVDTKVQRQRQKDVKEMIDETYFDSYSYFDIHRDMLGDKVRTDSYRDALEKNSNLVRGKRVLDVGCGTGILSMFAARGGAANVVGVDGSERIAAVAREIIKANGFADGDPPKIQVVTGKLEDIERLPFEQFDVLVSEWMGYCLLFESMLDTVLVARDKYLKPGGAILPDIATFFLAGFGRAAGGLDFWDNVYGFDMTHVGRVLTDSASTSKSARVTVVDSKDIVTDAVEFKRFDLATVKKEELEFHSAFTLKLSNGGDGAVPVLGVIVWFDCEFSKRFCAANPVVMSTSPHGTPTHWAQTLLNFKEAIYLQSSEPSATNSGSLGTKEAPATSITGRISIVRSSRHRSLDVSVEYQPCTAAGKGKSETIIVEV